MLSLRHHNYNWHSMRSCSCFYTSQQEKEVKLQQICLTSFSCQGCQSDQGTHNTGHTFWCLHFATTTSTDTVWGAALAFILVNRKRKLNYNGCRQYWREIQIFWNHATYQGGNGPNLDKNLTSSYLWCFLTDFVQILRADSLSAPRKLLLHGLWN